VVAGYVVELDSVPVHIVEHGQTSLASVRLRPRPAGEGPRMFTLLYGLRGAAGPGQHARPGVQFTS